MKNVCRAVALILTALGLVGLTPCRAASTVLYQFQGDTDGTWPMGRLLEYQGELYGTTYKGGTDDYGTVFKLTPPAKGKTAWTKTTLYSFTGYTDGYDGEYPMAGLILGPGNAFYGTTNGGGLYGYGTAFKLVPPSNGQSSWSEIVIYDFCSLSECDDGSYPQDSLLEGSDGELYGTTSEGGTSINKGTVFKLTPPSGVATKWPETVLYSFCSVGFLCDDGSHPLAELIADRQGALYSTTEFGGANDSGTVFKLTPPAPGKTDWTETVLYSFCSTEFDSECYDGLNPVAGLVADQQGALYGTTYIGGIPTDAFGDGTHGLVFRLSPPTNGGTEWTEIVLHQFKSNLRGANPAATLLIGPQGVLYGTTQFGGAGHPNKGWGTVFALTPPSQGGFHWSENVLTSFNNNSSRGGQPNAGVILYQGALYGTTKHGGQGAPASCIEVSTAGIGCGSVFAVPLPPGIGRGRTR